MVKKLFKHEYHALMRVLIPVYAIIVSLALIERVIQLFENTSKTFGIIRVFSIITFVVSIVVATVLTTILYIVRYYKNLFTGEGYLTFTLPVTPAQHLTVKLVTAVTTELLTLIVSLAATLIAVENDVITEVLKAAAYLIKEVPSKYSVNIVFWGIELFLAFVALLTMSTTLFYFCITVGQMAKKSRILASVGVYFGIYFATQVLSTIIVAIIAVNGDNIANLIEKFFRSNPILALYICFAIPLIIAAALSTVYFLLSRLIIKNKLNIE